MTWRVICASPYVKAEALRDAEECAALSPTSAKAIYRMVGRCWLSPLTDQLNHVDYRTTFSYGCNV
jgi:hypothetical protein